jgi:DNA polymerase V
VLAVEGSSLLDAGIAHEDLMVVDRGLEPAHNDVMLVNVDSDRILQRFLRRVHGAPAMPPQLNTALEARVWGVVTTYLH